MIDFDTVRRAYITIAEHTAASVCRNTTGENLVDVALDELKREILIELLDLNGSNKALVSRIIGCHRNSLDRNMKRLNIRSKRPSQKTIAAQRKKPVSVHA